MKNIVPPFQKLMKAHVPLGSTLIVAISGGPDSIYLLEQLRKFSSEFQFQLVIAHINHHLRGKASDADARFVKKLAQKYDLPYEEKNLQVKTQTRSQNLEEWAREERYKFLQKLQKKYRAAWILTAHHLNDNIETVLFNFLRGANLNGLKGMSLISEEQHLFRPLLETTKEEIQKYLLKHSVKYCRDASNDDLKFSRNRLRHKVIPELKKINPQLEKTLLNNLEMLNATYQFMEDLSQAWLKKNYQEGFFLLEKFLAEPRAFQNSILVELYKQLYGSTKKLTSNHLRQILQIFISHKSNRQKEFGSDYFILIQREKVQKVILKKAH